MKEVDIINGVRFGGELYDLSSVLKKFQKLYVLLRMFSIFRVFKSEERISGLILKFFHFSHPHIILSELFPTLKILHQEKSYPKIHKIVKAVMVIFH